MWALLTPLLFPGIQQAPNQDVASVHASFLQEAPNLDGRLDEPFWRTADLIDGLTEVEPGQGIPHDPLTEIRVARDSTHLYFGVTCWEPTPEKMVVQNMKRDAFLREDDRIEFVFDTFKDGRSGYFFQMSAGGSRGDALIGDNGSRFNKKWDGFWKGVAKIGEDRWTAEIAIPFATMAFGESGTWGFNIQRFRGANRSRARWAAVSRNLNLFNLSDAGELTGMENISAKGAFEVSPYLKFRNAKLSTGEVSRTADLGGEFNWRVTPQLKASFTLNTDFAETEVDQQRVNLTRFSLFFPEKRDFFLEDSTLFEFGEARSYRGGGVLMPFYSRRIGLTEDGDEVPIRAGLRVAGRSGPWDLGLLAVDTDDLSSEGVPAGQQFVFRPAYRMNREMSIGGLFTSGDPSTDVRNQVLGADFRFSRSEIIPGHRFAMNLFGLRGVDDATASRSVAWGAEGLLKSDDWEYSLKTYASQPDFNPGLGFVLRPGERYQYGRIQWEPRPSGESPFRKFSFHLRPKWWTDLSGDVTSHAYDVKFFGAEWNNGDSVELVWAWDGDRLDEAWDPVDGITINPGFYHYQKFEAEYSFSSARPLSGEIDLQVGDWYDGEVVDLSLSANWRPNAATRVGASLGEGRYDLLGGDFVSRTARLSYNHSFSPNLSVFNLLQYDNESNEVGFQSRTHLIAEDGRELFFVINSGWEDQLDRRFVLQDQDFTLKVVSSLRF